MTFKSRCGASFDQLAQLLAHVLKASYYIDIRCWGARIYLDREA